MRCPLTITILTKNEEKLLTRCISSVSRADEVLVLDSGSTDGTRDIAMKQEPSSLSRAGLAGSVSASIWCGGFRLGTLGLIYAMMRAHSFLRYGLAWELQNGKASTNSPDRVWRASDMPPALAQGRPDSGSH